MEERGKGVTFTVGVHRWVSAGCGGDGNPTRSGTMSCSRLNLVIHVSVMGDDRSERIEALANIWPCSRIIPSLRRTPSADCVDLQRCIMASFQSWLTCFFAHVTKVRFQSSRHFTFLTGGGSGLSCFR